MSPASRPDPAAAAVEEVLRRYLEELYHWNQRINLTSVRPDRAQRRHLDEARELLAVADPPAAARVVDIGSGAGVPGLVLAILRPDLRVTLVEADRRSAAFLVHAAAICGCRRVVVVPRRAEEVGRDPDQRDAHDLAVSRATAPAAVLCELALPLVRPGGRLLAMVADPAGDAVRAAAAAEACGGGPPAAVAPGILGVTKSIPTPSAYPRRPGVPARRPLG